MGSLFGQPQQRAKPTSVSVMGFFSSGRSTIIQRFNPPDMHDIPRKSFCIVEEANHRFSLGHMNISYRAMFLIKHYCERCPAIIYVVDISSSQYWQQAATQIKNMEEAGLLEDKALLVLFNKCDIKIIQAPELVDKLGLGEIKGCIWKTQQTNALTGQGLEEAFRWLDQVVPL